MDCNLSVSFELGDLKRHREGGKMGENLVAFLVSIEKI